MPSLFADIREQIFRDRMAAEVRGVLYSEASGFLSGIERARQLAEELGLRFYTRFKAGDALAAGDRLATVAGNPLAVAKGEEVLIGALSKTSGIATAARRACQAAGPGLEIVSGGAKKMPHQIRDMVRQAVADGGLEVRILSEPFIYLDKNYIRILGGIRPALNTVSRLHRKSVIQIRGETDAIDAEAVEAVLAGAAVIMVDTGNRNDLIRVGRALRERALRSRVKLAFAGNIKLDDITELSREDVDALDIGYAILDAPCLPIRFDVLCE